MSTTSLTTLYSTYPPGGYIKINMLLCRIDLIRQDMQETCYQSKKRRRPSGEEYYWNVYRKQKEEHELAEVAAILTKISNKHK